MRVRDEVCGMEIESDKAAGDVTLNGRMYYFCSERCRRMFKEHPDRYVPVAPATEHD